VSDGFRLVPTRIDPPIRKVYGSPRTGDQIETLVAEMGGAIVGVACISVATWNRRAVVEDLAVHPDRRGRGVGRALIEALEERARVGGARCLWLETQNINVPAIGFYRRLGFRFCGLDENLYDPVVHPGEVALFFERDVEPPHDYSGD
jgi:ribosomal protein S18 acetylase RimI-like enzyme